MLPVLEVLTEARNILGQGSKKWIQGTNAQDKQGNYVDPWDETAICFCSYGVIQRVVGNDQSALYDWTVTFLREALHEKFNSYISQMNDNSTYEEVLSYFDTAIDLAKKNKYNNICQ